MAASRILYRKVLDFVADDRAVIRVKDRTGKNSKAVHEKILPHKSPVFYN